MQIVIDIPEELYKANHRGLEAEELWDLRIAIKNGIPLDKIRAEIDKHCSDNRDRNDGLYIAMKIIDKYKAESEDKE